MRSSAHRQKQTLKYLSIAFVFFCGMGGALILAVLGVGSRIDKLHFAQRVLSAVGSKLPVVSTPFGKIELKTVRRNDGLELSLVCHDCRLRSKRLAQHTLEIEQAKIFGFYRDRHFKGTVQVDSIAGDLDTLWENEQAAGKFVLHDSAIADIFLALKSIVPEATTATITGRVSGKGKFSWPGIDLLFEPTVSGFTVDGLVSKERYLSGPFPINIRDEDGTPMNAISGEGSSSWVSLSQVGKLLPAAVLAAEDAAFYSHPGYDIEGMLEAAKQNREVQEIKRGGSTITQQLAKNLFLDGERTYARKLRELLYAVELERELGKKRVLEIYLNIVEWGPGIYGAKRAAQVYFRKAPADLLPEEAAWLASILNSPRRAFERQYVRNQTNLTKTRLILRRMKGLSDSARQQALNRQVRFARDSFAPPPTPFLLLSEMQNE